MRTGADDVTERVLDVSDFPLFVPAAEEGEDATL